MQHLITQASIAFVFITVFSKILVDFRNFSLRPGGKGGDVDNYKYYLHPLHVQHSLVRSPIPLILFQDICVLYSLHHYRTNILVQNKQNSAKNPSGLSDTTYCFRLNHG